MRSAYGLELLTDEREWLAYANCDPSTADWFWLTTGGPGRGERRTKLSRDNLAALALCNSCPVLANCLHYELTHPDPWPHIAAGRVWTGKETR